MGFSQDPLGGTATARVPTAAGAAERARRLQTSADAARYLVRRGHGDLLPMLGLTAPPTPEEAAADELLDDILQAEPDPPVRDDVVQDLLIGRRPAVRVDRAELDAAIDVLDGRGMSAREVAERLGTTSRQVTRRRAARRG